MPTRRPWASEDVELLRELARTFFAKEVEPQMVRFANQHAVDRSLWNRAGDLGLLCLSVPEEYGGGGGSFAHEAVMIEEQSAIGDTAWGAFLHSGIVAHYVLSYGTETQKRTWLPRMASGEVIGAIAMTEPGSGSDLKGIRTRAVRDGQHYLLNGSKTFITNGGQADLVVVAARTESEEADRGISLFLVDAGLSGFSRGAPLEKIGQHGQDTCELFFDNVRLDASSLLGQVEGQGFAQLMEQLPQERLIVAIQAVVPAEIALIQTLDYTKSRRAFGESIFDFQNTQFTLAEAATHTRVMRTFLDDCILRHLRGELDVATAAMAKWWCTDRSMAVLDDCLQLHGGYGYMKEYPIARMWVDQRVQRIYAGTNEIMKRIIARSL